MPVDPKKVKQIMLEGLRDPAIKRKLKALYRAYGIDNNDILTLTLLKAGQDVATVDISPASCEDITLEEMELAEKARINKFPQSFIEAYLEPLNQNYDQFLPALGIDGPTDDVELKLEFTEVDESSGVSEESLAATSSSFTISMQTVCRACSLRPCCF